MDPRKQNDVREDEMQIMRQCGRYMVVGLMIAVQATAFGFVEANTAPPDDLSSIRGIGPATAKRIIQARETRSFAHWKDFIARVRGIGEKRAKQLSRGGLRVRGKAYGDEQKWHSIAPRSPGQRKHRQLVDPFATPAPSHPAAEASAE
ncbi:helix-hairpin-helix domain-containing protein [Hydrogenophaga sp. 5NK40-0174]|uniref:ComEA family DNA-binding protein n=1 Tax=Hydrogenophaga sp. 5NK40-0174 TaxID=3127649 RepID=UPI003342119F